MRRFGAWRAKWLRKAADGWEEHPYRMFFGMILVQLGIQAFKHYAKQLQEEEEEIQPNDQDIADMIQQMKDQFSTVSTENDK